MVVAAPSPHATAANRRWPGTDPPSHFRRTAPRVLILNTSGPVRHLERLTDVDSRLEMLPTSRVQSRAYS